MCRVDVPVTFINEDKMLFLLFDVELEGSFKGTGSIWRFEGALMVQLMFINRTKTSSIAFDLTLGVRRQVSRLQSLH